MGRQLDGSITWLGHSTFLVHSPQGRRILIEGWVESNPACPERFHELADLDLIVLTHGHGDHCGDIAALARRSPNARIAGIVELIGWVRSKGIDAGRLIEFNKGGTIEPLDGISVTMVDARHSASNPDGGYAGEPAGMVIELEDDYTIYHAGDTCVFGDMAIIGQLYSPDIALLPIGGHYTMGPREAAHAVKLLGVAEVIGMHYGTFPVLTGTPQQLREQIQGNVQVHELQPGETLGKVPASASA